LLLRRGASVLRRSSGPCGGSVSHTLPTEPTGPSEGSRCGIGTGASRDTGTETPQVVWFRLMRDNEGRRSRGGGYQGVPVSGLAGWGTAGERNLLAIRSDGWRG